MNDLLPRMATALVGGGLLLAVAYVGSWPFGLAVLLLGLAAQVEVYQLLERMGMPAWRTAGLLLGAMLALRALVPGMIPAAVLTFLALVAWCPLSKSAESIQKLGATAMGAIYPTALLAFLTDIRLGSADAFSVTLSVLLLVWATDVFAYVTGRLVGKHPLAPSISPAKTWEGFYGGIVGALLVAVALRLTFVDFVIWRHMLELALLCSLAAHMGDLAASRFKRSAGAKDAGTLLPGHGGVLDRFDGAILAIPISYYYLLYVAKVFAA